MLEKLGGVQLDTISTLARSHELVAYSRLDPLDRTAVEGAFWGPPYRAFEYWAHAACILPLASWPWFAAERRRRRDQPYHRRLVSEPAVREVRARLAAEGAQTVAELGGGRLAEGWWNWSPVKIAVEELYNIGEVVCVTRRGWRRVYDLAERAIPPELLNREPADAECYAAQLNIAAAGLGVATERDFEHYFSLNRDAVRLGLEGAGLAPVRVAGWPGQAWASPAALTMPASGGPRGRRRTTLLSPFDSLLWDRRRVLRIFGFQHKLEAYVPAPNRVHGYYTMPLLTGGRLRGRVDPGREGTTLVARQVSVEPGAERAMATALGEAASWVACDRVVVARVEPAASRAPIESALVVLGLA
ncbi:MAG TPA: crosslink repair DNA glycosylase YcaQ family protein [Candidatus Dormibacteraeota bacterium]|nr:crosslink repair DNA glycosylase YcaQ family protein [Candidatus Dormibacteraeota bacterium]